MTGTYALTQALLAYLKAAVPVQVSALNALYPTPGFEPPNSWYPQRVPVGQIDQYPALMIQPAAGGAPENVEATDFGKIGFKRRYQPQVYLYARGNSFEETGALRDLGGDAVFQALLADGTLGHPGELTLVPSGLRPDPSSEFGVLGDARSVAGWRATVTIDVFETAPVVQPPNYADVAIADQINLTVRPLAWEPA